MHKLYKYISMVLLVAVAFAITGCGNASDDYAQWQASKVISHIYAEVSIPPTPAASAVRLSDEGKFVTLAGCVLRYLELTSQGLERYGGDVSVAAINDLGQYAVLDCHNGYKINIEAAFFKNAINETQIGNTPVTTFEFTHDYSLAKTTKNGAPVNNPQYNEYEAPVYNKIMANLVLEGNSVTANIPALYGQIKNYDSWTISITELGSNKSMTISKGQYVSQYYTYSNGPNFFKVTLTNEGLNMFKPGKTYLGRLVSATATLNGSNKPLPVEANNIIEFIR